MTSRKTALTALCCVPLFLGMMAEEASHPSGSSDFLGKVINFVVLFGGLGYVLYKPIRNFLVQSSRNIQTALDEAREARTNAEKKLGDAQQRIAALEGEVVRMKIAAEEEGLREKERIKALAEKEAERIRSFAEQEMSLQLKAGIQELTEYTAGLASSLAEARLKKRMTNNLQSDLIDKSIERLAELNERSHSH
jgi:F-type H+-transporting ATPase subunit b